MSIKITKNWQKGLIVGILLVFVYSAYNILFVNWFYDGNCVGESTRISFDSYGREVYQCDRFTYLWKILVNANFHTLGFDFIALPLTLFLGPLIIGFSLDKIRSKSNGNIQKSRKTS